MMGIVFSFLLMLELTVALGAQDEIEKVEVRVTGVTGTEVYLDKGSDDGVARGDSIELTTDGGERMLGVIRSVSRSSSRAVFQGDLELVGAGTVGEVLIPVARLRDRELIEHPPWEHAPLEWEVGQPLLAPVESRTPAERDTRVRGRTYLRSDLSDDAVVDQRFLSYGAGLDLDVENPFGRGNAFTLELDWFARVVEIQGAEDDTTSRLRIDRASYRRDVLRGRQHGWEVGRFLSSEFPELGILDGGEYVHRTNSGNRFGTSVGFLPSSDDNLSSGEDAAASVFYRYVSGADESFALGAALQKTWHEGAADRDLLIATLDARPGKRASLYGTAWIDYYTSGDDLKSPGFELTQLQLGANWRAESGFGLGIFGSQLRWPDIDREEFRATPETIRDGHVTRLGVSGWVATTKRTRLNGRVSNWKDESDDGGNGSLRFSMRDVLYDHGEVSLEFFGATGSFSDSVGARFVASRRLDAGYLRFVADSTEFDQEGFVGGQSKLRQTTLRLSYDVTIGSAWDLSLYVEDRSGDEQDTTGAGFYLQRRF